MPASVNRINHQITARQVRCIDANGSEIGVMSKSDALRKTHEMGVDLIEIQPNANPPVCRMMELGKFRYMQKKSEKECKQVVKKQKEVCFQAGIDENDKNRKIKDIIEFLVDGHPVRAEVKMLGRDQGHVEFGWAIINTILAETKNNAAPANSPALAPCKGGVMIAVSLNPKKAVQQE